MNISFIKDNLLFHIFRKEYLLLLWEEGVNWKSSFLDEIIIITTTTTTTTTTTREHPVQCIPLPNNLSVLVVIWLWWRSVFYGWLPNCNGDFLILRYIYSKLFMKIWSTVIVLSGAWLLVFAGGMRSMHDFPNVMGTSLAVVCRVVARNLVRGGGGRRAQRIHTSGGSGGVLWAPGKCLIFLSVFEAFWGTWNVYFWHVQGPILSASSGGMKCLNNNNNNNNNNNKNNNNNNSFCYFPLKSKIISHYASLSYLKPVSMEGRTWQLSRAGLYMKRRWLLSVDSVYHDLQPIQFLNNEFYCFIY